jgi:asparagine synthase (glutamine-hydrolysing)
MCGIVGLVDTRGPVDPERIDALRQIILHRGPDSGGTIVRETSSFSVGLGAQRLSILDLSPAGAMPMPNEDETIWIVYNGELYNHAEIRQNLEGRGHRYRSRSDTETVIHAYEEFGTDCFARFNGMFACIIFDGPRDRVVVARDRMGIKPLYYSEDDGRFVCASELKALCRDGLVPFELDLAALDVYLALGYVPAPQCLVRGVKKLEAGSYGVFDARGFRITRYWRPVAAPEGIVRRPWDQVVEATRTAVSDTVRRQMMSDVPVGVLLSGGLDSSIVAAVARRCSDGPFHTFSVGFDTGIRSVDAHFNADRRHAAIVASSLGTTHHEVVIDSTVPLEPLLRRLLAQLDEPTWELSFLSIYLMSSLARSHGVKVLLTGDGSDELFAGYPWHPALRRLEAVDRIPLLRPVFAVADRLPLSPELQTKLSDLQRKYRRSDMEKYLAHYGVFDVETRARGLARPVQADPVRAILEPIFADNRRASLSARFAVTELALWVGDHFNQRIDRMTMAASVEGRVPYQDNAVVDLALSLPLADKLRGGRGKAPLRAAFADHLPAEVIQRPKRPFAVPVQTWLQRELVPLALRSMTADVWDGLPGLDAAVARRLQATCSAALGPAAPARPQQILALSNLVLWIQEFGRAASTASAPEEMIAAAFR